MNETAASAQPTASSKGSAVRQRLDRLEGYLREDPQNQALLIDAFETALRCGEWSRAQFHLRHGQALQTEALAWQLREGDYWLAQRNHAQARLVLEALLDSPNPPPGFADVVLHNLAYIDLRGGNFVDCVTRLAARMTPAPASGPGAASASEAMGAAESALQQLWLRALHHAGELERACAWASSAEQAHSLDSQAAGVASLAALDAGQMEMAQRWSALALSGGQSMEALVTQASIALAARDAGRARQLADAALQINPGDGRAWSARAFAQLLAGALPAARDDFSRALQAMPEHIGTWHGQGWTQLLQKDFAAAQASFETALSLDRNFAESHGGLAVVLALRQQAHAAQEHIERALRLDSSNLSGRYAQALLNGEVKDSQTLQRLAKRLLGNRAAPLGGQMADLIAPGTDGFDAKTQPPAD